MLIFSLFSVLHLAEHGGLVHVESFCLLVFVFVHLTLMTLLSV